MTATIANRAKTNESDLKLKRILVPVDFSPLSERAFHQAVRLAGQFKSELTLLHVLEPVVPVVFEGLAMTSPYSGEETEGVAKAMRSLVTAARAAAIPKIKSRIVRGLAAHEIVEIASQFESDLIVMGTHGYTGWKHFCIGSTAERVVRAASCSVLVIRDKRPVFA